MSRTQPADADQADAGQADASHAKADAARPGPERRSSTAELAAWDALLAVHQRVNQIIERDLWRQYTLAPRQLTILRCVADAPGRRIGLPALRGKLGLSAADTSRLCHVLETRGLLTRRRASQSSVLTLTDLGAELTRLALETQLDDIRTHLLGRLGPEEVTALATMLTRINQP